MSGSLGFSKSASNNQSDQRIWKEQSPYLQNLYGSAQSMFNNPNERLNAGYNAQNQYAGSQELGNTISGAQNALNFNLDPNNAGNNPYLQRAMQSAIRPLTQNYQENVLSGVTDQAVQAGQSGSSRQGIAEGIAARGYMDQVGDITSQMAYQDYGAGMDRMSNAIGQAGSVANLGMLPSSIQRDAGMQDWDRLGRYQGIIGGPTTLGSSSGASKSRSFQTSGGIGG